jgi:hypothetical protein
VGTWGPGAFDNDDALDLLDALSGQDTAARRHVLDRIFREAREHPENLNFTLGAAEVVAAAAWHRDWTDPRTAAQARQTTDQLASVFYRHQHRHDQELPLEP